MLHKCDILTLNARVADLGRILRVPVSVCNIFRINPSQLTGYIDAPNAMSRIPRSFRVQLDQGHLEPPLMFGHGFFPASNASFRHVESIPSLPELA